MKKLYFSFLSVLAVLTANAQLTQANHAPAVADTYTLVRCDSVNTTPGVSGPNAIWNFSGITTYNNLVRNYQVQAASNSTYTAANIAVASAANDIEYLSSTTNTLGYYGGNLSAGGIVGNITYNAPAIYASYPMSLNTMSSTATSGTLYIPAFSLSGSFTGNSHTMADGSGTISLPNSMTFTNTLRVVTSQTLNITSSFANATVTMKSYNFYASTVKAPVFVISTSTAVLQPIIGGPSTTTQTSVSRILNPAIITPTNPGTSVGITENNTEAITFGVFPNPSSTNVNVVTNHPDAMTFSVYDITGKLAEKQTLVEGKGKIDVSSYNKGLYLYTISSGENKVLKSGKITVSH